MVYVENRWGRRTNEISAKHTRRRTIHHRRRLRHPTNHAASPAHRRQASRKPEADEAHGTYRKIIDESRQRKRQSLETETSWSSIPLRDLCALCGRICGFILRRITILYYSFIHWGRSGSDRKK